MDGKHAGQPVQDDENEPQYRQAKRGAWKRKQKKIHSEKKIFVLSYKSSNFLTLGEKSLHSFATMWKLVVWTIAEIYLRKITNIITIFNYLRMYFFTNNCKLDNFLEVLYLKYI